MFIVDDLLSKKKYIEALHECLRTNQYNLGFLLATCHKKTETNLSFNYVYSSLEKGIHAVKTDGCIVQEIVPDIVQEIVPDIVQEIVPDIIQEIVPDIVQIEVVHKRLYLLCNWMSSQDLCSSWDKMSKGNGIWGNIKVVSEEPCDYYVVINSPPRGMSVPLEKTILFRMEPHMEKHPEMWGDWASPDKSKLLFSGFHDTHYNNIEWNIGKTYTELINYKVDKQDDLNHILSTVLSDKYSDIGQIKRIDFVKFLDSKGFPVHVYGGNKFKWVNYKGSLTWHEKDPAMFPYKYTFNVENHMIENYFTEKIVDSILAESLCFYSGCPNIREHIDPDAYVWLELSNFEKDYETIKTAISEDWWSKRLPAIQREKKRIIEEKQFFPRVEKIVNELH